MSAADPRATHGESHYEFDRERVAESQLLGPGYFAGSYAGEHVAATEFVIGASFVAWGASIADVFFGLAVGNLLAVLNWRFLCAPIAVDTRLTLYWYLRRIGGPTLTAIANVLNALLYCALAGAMITVSASALRIPFGIPPQTQLYPTDPRFVLLVCAVGGAVTWIAISGFKRVAGFASVCAPWMFLMFLAGAISVLPALGEAAGVGTPRSLGDLWRIGELAIWTGRTADGSPGLGFAHVAAFAWVCNLAMNAGLSDMAILRYAKQADYAYFSFNGTFLGHYVAWIAAGVMGAGAAVLLETPLQALDSGAVAYAALGWSGALAVVIAGWTTSNPTIYRAGLALQAVSDAGSRTRVTLFVGIVTTVIACFPFVFTRLLDFVGLYGLLLSPPGAIVLTEHWLFPRLGLRRYWLEAQGLSLNKPALVAWTGSVLVAWLLNQAGVHLFFLFVPVYCTAGLLYLVLARAAAADAPGTSGGHEAAASATTGSGPAAGRRGSDAIPADPAARRVRWLLGSVAALALLACVLLPIRVFLADAAAFDEALENAKLWLVPATLVYFIAGTLLLVRRTVDR